MIYHNIIADIIIIPHHYWWLTSGNLHNIAMDNGPSIDVLPIQDGDVP